MTPPHHWPKDLAAFHEAGHAVVAVVLGVPIGAATIDDGPNGPCGEVELPDIGRYRPERQGWVERENLVTVYVAGKIAESKWCQSAGVSPRPFSDQEDQKATWPHLRRLGKNQRDTVERMQARARVLLDEPEVWAAVERVAQTLLRRRRLAAATVKRLVAAAMAALIGPGDTPPWLA